MKKYKTGFTLFEVLVSITVIGVIMALSVNAIKIARASYTSLAYFAHKNVLDMTSILFSGSVTGSEKKKIQCTEGEGIKDIPGMEGRICPKPRKGETNSYVYQLTGFSSDKLKFGNDSLPSMVTKCKSDKDTSKNFGKYLSVLKHDNEWEPSSNDCSKRASYTESGKANSNLFCKSLTAIANTSGEKKCGEKELFALEGSGDSLKLAGFNAENPNFTLTNGMRFYISKWAYDASNVSPDYGYRLISVDVNGKSGPNRRDTDAGTRPADIITFLILDNGEVYPLGAAADNVEEGEHVIQYLNTRIKGYHYYAGSRVRPDGGEAVFTKFSHRDDFYVPEECKNQNIADTYKCNLTVYQLENSYNSSLAARDKRKAQSNFSYREALCAAKGGNSSAGINSTLGWTKYCTGYTQDPLCPPSPLGGNGTEDELDNDNQPVDKVYDQCRVETVKPAFRYNL